MQISCPGCKSRIQVPDDRIKPTGTKVKCGKCEKVFTVRKKSAGTAAKAAPSKAAATPPPAARPANTDSNLLEHDNFAEMDNFKTQVRPMSGDRDAGLFGDSESLSATPSRDDAEDDLFGGSEKQEALSSRGSSIDDLFGTADELAAPEQASPNRDDSAGDLFGDAENLAGPDPEAETSAPEDPLGDATDDPLDKFVADIRGTREEQEAEEAAAAKKASSPAADEPSDDMFGGPMEDDRDDFGDILGESDNKSTSTRESSADIDALFDSPDDTPPKKAETDKLDALFSDEADDEPAPRKKAAVAAPAPPPEPSPEEIGKRMNLEPALKEEDAPPPVVEKREESKKTPAKRRSIPKGKLALLVIVLLIGGGVASFFTVPEVRRVAEPMLARIPVDQMLALLPGNGPEAPPPRPLLTTSVRDHQMVTGVRSDNIYIIEGRVRNDYDASRSFIRVRGYLKDEAGEIVAVRDVFAGNTVSRNEVRSSDRVRIDEMLNRSVGAELSNLGVKPGESIPFQIVFYDVAPNIKDVEVEPIGSQPGT